ncbi:MAG: hypothetical protein M3O50_09335 [Myxococcota bacterium]|nr:hypothetical protein [Myxococcota bacterium]
MTSESKFPSRSRAATRVMAFTALTLFVSGVGYGAREVYRAATDSFVAPIILSPDNDMVLASKVKMSELNVERARTVADSEAIDADLAAGEKALVRLDELKRSGQHALAWTIDISARQASAGAVDLRKLAEQKQMLGEMLAKQEALASDAHANLQAGLVSKMDYAREVQALDQVRIALLENERTRAQAELQLLQVSLERRSLSSTAGAPATPEMILHEDQMLRVELDVLKLEAEMRAKRAEKRVLAEKLATIDELEGQLKTRPIVRAMEKSMDIAFVPYTQRNGVQPGARVLDCLWGLLHCKDVGEVAEVVPGEVILPDPWGSQARGQYAVLALTDHDAAMSKILRVRGLTVFSSSKLPPSSTSERGRPDLSVR